MNDILFIELEIADQGDTLFGNLLCSRKEQHVTKATFYLFMVPSNALQRTFHVKYGNGIGTAFTLDRDGRQYLVSARHVFHGVGFEGDLEIYHDKRWISLRFRVIGTGEGEADIIVLALEQIVSPLHEFNPAPNDLYLSQDVFFLGFPFGLTGDGKAVNNDFPLPFVKKACVSCLEFDQGILTRLWLDGHNNPGFSGGPVVFATGGMPFAPATSVAGVISGYRFDSSPVLDPARNPTGYSVDFNTGIISVTGIGHVTRIIDSNPVGFPL